jgi:hypothetical protein
MSADVRAFMSVAWDLPSTSELGIQLEELMAKSTCPISKDVLYVSPLCLKTKLDADGDTPSYNNILRMDTATQEEWIKAMNKELRTLYEFGVYETVDRSDAQGRQIVPSHWAFKIKRRADGSFLKYKARLTIRGDLQLEGLKEGTSVHDSDGYAPTVEFGTVRMLLTMSVMHDLHTTQVDWKNAFTQAHLERPYYMEFPPGVRDLPHLQGKVMKLKRSLYGNKFAAKLFYNVVKEALTTPKSQGGPGFRVSEYDHCLFIRDDCIAINWVDDTIFISKDPKVAEQVVQILKKNGYDLDIESVEGGLRDYLGIDYQKMPDGKSLMCTQTGLIDRIIEATHLEDANPAHTPIVAPLGKCKDSQPFNGNFNYRSVIGMLIYLYNTTRPDIGFAVTSCARFSHDPKVEHGTAIKRIVCYLKKTKHMGLVIRPSNSNVLDAYSDADFAGLYGVEDPEDPTSCRSRTGFLVTLGSNPLVWCSKLQTLVAAHTMEAKYIALSEMMKHVLFLRGIHAEITSQCTSLKLPPIGKSEITTVFQDNQAARILAATDLPRMTPRSKAIAVRYHWFRQHLHPDRIVMSQIPSKNNPSNILTKALDRVQFTAERRMILNWPDDYELE